MQIEPAAAVPADAIARCLEAIEGRDPLALPVEFGAADRERAWVALDGDRRVVGVGWLRPVDDGHRVEVRVLPGQRRRGVGSALFSGFARLDQALLASCDAGQHQVRRFLEARGFEATDVVFVQRWDGAADEVPGAFRSAVIGAPGDGAVVARLLAEGGEAGGRGFEPPLSGGAGLGDPATRVRVAWVEGEPVGVCAARGADGAWVVGALGVRSWARGRGVGRSLLCELMSAAAAADLGVVLHASHQDEPLVEWTRRLGFWTCRSFVTYRRPAAREVGRQAG